MPAVGQKTIYTIHLPSGSGVPVQIEMDEGSTLADLLTKATQNGRDVSGAYRFMAGGKTLELDQRLHNFQTTIIASPSEVKGN